MVRIKDICYDIMLNYHLSQKLKLIKKKKFNHLINTLSNESYINYLLRQISDRWRVTLRFVWVIFLLGSENKNCVEGCQQSRSNA
jgi:uncharacterized protein YpbB